jgi:hypothetical protein
MKQAVEGGASSGNKTPSHVPCTRKKIHVGFFGGEPLLKFFHDEDGHPIAKILIRRMRIWIKI